MKCYRCDEPVPADFALCDRCFAGISQEIGARWGTVRKPPSCYVRRCSNIVVHWFNGSIREFDLGKHVWAPACANHAPDTTEEGAQNEFSLADS